jgi:hypothetical protein
MGGPARGLLKSAMNFDIRVSGPCAKLWLTVLCTAVVDARGEGAVTPRETWDAKLWLHYRHTNGARPRPGSFEWICDTLGADPDRLLEWLKLTKEHCNVNAKQAGPAGAAESGYAPGAARGGQCTVCSHKGYKRCCCRSQRGSIASRPNTRLPVEKRGG